MILSVVAQGFIAINIIKIVSYYRLKYSERG